MTTSFPFSGISNILASKLAGNRAVFDRERAWKHLDINVGYASIIHISLYLSICYRLG